MKRWGTLPGDRLILLGLLVLVLGCAGYGPLGFVASIAGTAFGMYFGRWIDGLRMGWDERKAMEAEYGPYRKVI